MFSRFAILPALAALMLGAPAMAQVTPAACAAAKAYSAAHDGVSLLVLKDGVVVCEDYPGGTAETAHELASGTKSFVGLMAAAAVQDHLLTLDEKVSDTITAWRGDTLKGGVMIRQLLSMTSGLPSRIGQVPTFADSLTMPFNAPPGTKFQYGPAPMQVFGELLRRKLHAVGRPEDPLAYLTTRILDPIGLHPTQWRRGPDGMPLLPQGAVLTAREWAKMGEFVRAGGRVNGNAIVDPTAFAALFQGSAVNPAYGLTWWLPRKTTSGDVVTASNSLAKHADDLPKDLVAAAGAGHQLLIVIPSLKLVIVRQATINIGKLMREVASGARDPDAWSDYALISAVLGRSGG
jgi:CubicO group peptidase (beta-lactamase class C family)